MTAAAALLFVFALGFMTGAMALYTIWRVVICSPAYWEKVFASIGDVFPPGRWVRVHGDHLRVHCPACDFSESSKVPQ